MEPIEVAMEKVKSKFRLVTILSKRAKMLREFKGRYVEGVNEHFISRAAREVNAGDVKYKEKENENAEN